MATPVTTMHEVVENGVVVGEQEVTTYEIEKVIEIHIETITCRRCGGTGDEPPSAQLVPERYGKWEHALRQIGRWLKERISR